MSKEIKQKKKKSLISSIMILCTIVVVLTACGVGLNAVISIKSMGTNAYLTYEQAMNDGYKTEIKSQVQSTMAVLQSEYDQAQAGLKTEEEAKETAKEIIRVMRYRDDQSGYFWIDDTDYTLVMHPILTEQEGNNRYELKDQDGVMIVQEIMKVCQSADKGGYNEFAFTKADGVTVAPKVAYSQIFEPWGWAVSTGNYVDDMEVEMKLVEDSLNALYDSALVRVDIVFCVMIAIALVIAFLFGRQMVIPIKRIQIFADKLSEGDLTTKVDIKQNNEIGQMAESLSVAQHNIRGLLQDMSVVVQGVNHALEKFDGTFYNMKTSITEVSTAVESIAGNVNDQASSTDDASGEVKVMADRIERTSQEIRTLDDNANDMKQLSEQSMGTLNHLIAVNGKTSTNISAMYEQTQLTNKSVQQIKEAANLIYEISDQTSLLALNASIEAARAGESGKGFAVVADEIGKLAQQSASSVEEIDRVVEGLLDNASKSVNIMKEMRESVDTQVSSLSETQKIFNQLYKELDNCVNAVQAIDTMTGEIENQRGNVTGALETLNRLAQDNATVTQQTAAMSCELSQVVDDSGDIVSDLEHKVEALVESVNRFKV